MEYRILENIPLTDSVFRMVLEGDTSKITRPGQFVNVSVPGYFLRRPISVCDWDDTTLTLIYKVVGDGTEAMSRMQPGDEVDLLTGLGNGFDVTVEAKHPLVVGGGVGVPPLYRLTKELLKAGKRPTVMLGFNTVDEVFYAKEFDALGVGMIVVTSGYVTDRLPSGYDYVYACGPLPMLRALADRIGTAAGQFSFEERMGCGFGACMGCSCQTKSGDKRISKRICKEGPVFKTEEILWETCR